MAGGGSVEVEEGWPGEDGADDDDQPYVNLGSRQ